ncbi:MAG: LysM peptidoglycan-binding domain-containing protein [Candidatus Mcinerneyibacterium aminivorans]|uniref:LysM peptidoglycan-binding domain-containing protein n=1 Tax=Candidatus Mcinerneyibacterium aminivorans TaxID=2703815 RepID=A0A5D0MI04_9BACT|nr:MAG: LysM peptidoglycan-binding domain-containing protein [Candidatus Mcinerneyibacterium aminivorans]
MKKRLLFVVFFIFIVSYSANNIVPEQGNPPPYPGPRGQKLKGENVYTVKKGDTLWDICKQKLNNPWDWIKVWERNPHITNPNWIYPKDKISLDLSRSIKDSYVREENREKYRDKRISGVFKFKDHKDEDKNGDSEEPLSRDEEIYDEGSKMKITKKDAIKVEKAYQEKIRSMRFRAGFILEEEIENYGKIVKAQDNEAITPNDIVFIDFEQNNNFKKGQELIIFDFGVVVEHPVTYENLGKMIVPRGTLEIINVEKDIVKAKVGEQFKNIHEGDFVVPEYPKINLANEKIEPKYEGYISYIENGKNLAGENDFVYIDLGIKQGIRTGMHFDILAKKEKIKSSTGVKDIPTAIKGELLVINARKNVSTAVVLYTRKNYKINIGNMIRAK